MKKTVLVALILSALTFCGASVKSNAKEISSNISKESVATSSADDILSNSDVAKNNFEKLMEKEHEKTKPKSTKVTTSYIKVKDNLNNEITTPDKKTKVYTQQQFEQELNPQKYTKQNYSQLQGGDQYSSTGPVAHEGWIQLTLEIDNIGSSTVNIYGFYEWLSYPKIMGSDIIALGHDANLNFNFANNRAVNMFEYTDGQGNWHDFSQTLTPSNTSSRALDVGGIGYKFRLQGDANPAGFSYAVKPYGHIYVQATKGASYNGPVTFTYAHQEVGTTFGGLGFSIPMGGTVNLNWTTYYDKFTVADTAHL